MPTGAFFRIRAVFICVAHHYLTFMNKLIQYFKETKTELKEVVFPTTAQTITFTILVIVISIVVAAGLGGLDAGLSKVLKAVINR